MAIFRQTNDGGYRSVEDRKRHRELVKEAIRKNLPGIIAKESIIGESKTKKIKVPIPGKKEFQFIFGKNQKGVSSGTGNEKRGDVLGKKQDGAGKGQGAGNEEGNEIYETEITIEEVVNLLFDNMQLPDLNRRKLSDIESIDLRKLGFQRKGIPPRLAKIKSAKERIKRRQGARRPEPDNQDYSEMNETPEEKRFPFIEDDLRYSRLRTENKKTFNAVVFCIMDVSGSMDETKKYLARTFYFLLYQFLRLTYEHVEIVFIAHTTTAKEVTEDEFFHRGESGGTKISSGYQTALDIIEERYNPESWNIYAFHSSDGDNFSDDNIKAINLARELCEVCNMFGYVEIPLGYYFDNTFTEGLSKSIKDDKFHIVQINDIKDVFPALKKLLDSEGGNNYDV